MKGLKGFFIVYFRIKKITHPYLIATSFRIRMDVKKVEKASESNEQLEERHSRGG
jgi:hypothetical protein